MKRKLFAIVLLSAFALCGALPSNAGMGTYRHIEYWILGKKISEVDFCDSAPSNCLPEVVITP